MLRLVIFNYGLTLYGPPWECLMYKGYAYYKLRLSAKKPLIFLTTSKCKTSIFEEQSTMKKITQTVKTKCVV